MSPVAHDVAGPCFLGKWVTADPLGRNRPVYYGHIFGLTLPAPAEAVFGNPGSVR